ncbi:hypothetical protein ZOSMA_98G00140 [Zostera marina]|uniref:CCHC-type domain-containing protein n=1 Tax=Zostera marina TaxID=29655 RepID=A0A0K9NJQ5_ZOSMR|nr:hypothetical protein ZOSMA_98G00140 [Zostera marina]
MDGRWTWFAISNCYRFAISEESRVRCNSRVRCDLPSCWVCIVISAAVRCVLFAAVRWVAVRSLCCSSLRFSVNNFLLIVLLCVGCERNSGKKCGCCAATVVVVVANVQNALPTTFNILSWCHTPLSKNNYIWWRDQFTSVQLVHDLGHLIDETYVPSNKTIGDYIPNPDYNRLLKENYLVVGWVKETISAPICPVIRNEIFVLAVWRKLEATLSPKCKQYTRHIKDQLRTLKKTSDLSMTDYIIQVKSLVDFLIASGTPVSEDVLIDHIIDGLGDEFNNFLHNLHFQRDSMTFQKVFGILLQKEHLLKRINKSSVVDVVEGTALATSRGPRRNFKGRKYYQKGKNNNQRDYQGENNYGNNHHRRRDYHKNENISTYQGNGKGKSDSKDLNSKIQVPASINDNVICQLCNKPGHTARKCYQRANYAYVTYNGEADDEWVTDSGATHHMSPSTSRFTDYAPYEGNDNIFIGDGTPLNIT